MVNDTMNTEALAEMMEKRFTSYELKIVVAEVVHKMDLSAVGPVERGVITRAGEGRTGIPEGTEVEYERYLLFPHAAANVRVDGVRRCGVVQLPIPGTMVVDGGGEEPGIAPLKQ